jgi:hypothetical protein
MSGLVLVLLLVSVTSAGMVQTCTTYEEKSLQRLQTICSDGTRGVSLWNPTLQRWDTTVMPPAGTWPERRHPDPGKKNQSGGMRPPG